MTVIETGRFSIYGEEMPESYEDLTSSEHFYNCSGQICFVEISFPRYNMVGAKKETSTAAKGKTHITECRESLKGC